MYGIKRTHKPLFTEKRRNRKREVHNLHLGYKFCFCTEQVLSLMWVWTQKYAICHWRK